MFSKICAEADVCVVDINSTSLFKCHIHYTSHQSLLITLEQKELEMFSMSRATQLADLENITTMDKSYRPNKCCLPRHDFLVLIRVLWSSAESTTASLS